MVYTSFLNGFIWCKLILQADSQALSFILEMGMACCVFQCLDISNGITANGIIVFCNYTAIILPWKIGKVNLYLVQMRFHPEKIGSQYPILAFTYT